ncbi:Cell division protein FtsQ [bacterium HR12]|nr:Cell division protein FtsQ [bacterium HR12]
MERSTISRADGDVGRTVRRWLAAVGLGSLVVAAVLVGVSRSPLLRVRDVRVVGTSHTPPHRVERLAEVPVGEPILWLDESSIRERVLRDPWIADVRIDLELPSRVTLHVSERSPIATLEVAGWPVLVAEDGTVLGPGPTRGLPRIVLPAGPVTRREPRPELGTLTRLLATLDPAVRAQVRQLEVEDGGELGLRLDGRILVRLGAAREVQAKARALRAVLSWAAEQGVRPGVVNVIAPTVPTLTIAD